MKKVRKSKAKTLKIQAKKSRTKTVQKVVASKLNGRKISTQKKALTIKLKSASKRMPKVSDRPKSRLAATSITAFTAEHPPVRQEYSQVTPQESELPFSYNKTKLVLMTRDPYSIFCYWDFSSQTWNWLQSILKTHNGNCRAVLRVLEVTGIDYRGSNALSAFDIDVLLEAKNWYVHVNKPDSEWIFELGLIDPLGNYYMIIRSNRVRTPRDGPSDLIDEEWMAIDFDEIYALSGGFGIGLSSGEISKLIKERYLLQKALFSSFSRETNPPSVQKASSA